MGSPRYRRFFGLLFLAVLCGQQQSFPQGLTGQIGASVYDPSDAAISGAQITLESQDTKQMRTTVSDRKGNFVFSEVLPCSYVVTIQATGFKEYRQDDVILTATQRLALRPITLAVGSATQEVTVHSDGAVVETQSGERSGSISDKQLTELPTIGRNFMSLLNLVPGVIQTAEPDAPNTNTLSATVNGSRGQSISLLVE